MIRYTLTCDRDHRFDSWFANAAAFDALKGAGQLECPTCASRRVDKALMAPAVVNAVTTADTPTPAKTPEALLAERLAALRRHVEENSDYVGVEFVSEARAIHEGLAPERPIWGEAKPDEARKLIEDGVPVAPLPFVPRAKTN
jgi:hypothetical protein